MMGPWNGQMEKKQNKKQNKTKKKKTKKTLLLVLWSKSRIQNKILISTDYI